jgi:glycosyltransferase involved in cell wall biosynthesis
MLSEPSIGICILTYNSSTTIPYTLHFLLRQNYPKDKIFYLVVDGGSNDNTVEIVKNILSKHTINYQIIVVPHSNIPQARNICLDILEC